MKNNIILNYKTPSFPIQPSNDENKLPELK